ncbi:zinc-binding dehydrogenase [Nonomuraea sp. NPDC050643]|uniref:zinc-binding dehydrogenase n=1 Tax=Nonomuraea sp. NPDC050643 TaxID=3155660 RepID=UPI0033D916E2
MAQRLGADAAAGELTGEYDVIFDAVGAAVTRRQSVALLRPGGAAIWLGLAEPAPGFDATDVVRNEKQVIGSFAYSDADFATAAELVGGWDLSWVETFPLGEGARLFTSLMNGAPTPVKALLSP